MEPLPSTSGQPQDFFQQEHLRRAFAARRLRLKNLRFAWESWWLRRRVPARQLPPQRRPACNGTITHRRIVTRDNSGGYGYFFMRGNMTPLSTTTSGGASGT